MFKLLTTISKKHTYLYFIFELNSLITFDEYNLNKTSLSWKFTLLGKCDKFILNILKRELHNFARKNFIKDIPIQDLRVIPHIEVKAHFRASVLQNVILIFSKFDLFFVKKRSDFEFQTNRVGFQENSFQIRQQRNLNNFADFSVLNQQKFVKNVKLNQQSNLESAWGKSVNCESAEKKDIGFVKWNVSARVVFKTAVVLVQWKVVCYAEIKEICKFFRDFDNRLFVV